MKNKSKFFLLCIVGVIISFFASYILFISIRTDVDICTNIFVALEKSNGIKFFEIWQTLTVVIAIVAFIASYYRAKRATYTEVNKRYESFNKLLHDNNGEIIGFKLADISYFESKGGSRKDLLLYDMLFGNCEYAFGLYGHQEKDWKRWEEWLLNFFSNDPKCLIAWEIASEYYEKEFRVRIEDLVVDKRYLKHFPNSDKEWIEASPENGRLEIVNKTKDHTLMINGFQVMQSWEKPIMKSMGEIVKCDDTVLEVGYGLGICSNFIREKNPKLHVIIECNSYIASLAKDKYKNEIASGKMVVIEALWQQVDENYFKDEYELEGFDAIVFDTFPLKKDELKRNHFKFFETANNWLISNGRFSYFSDQPDFLEESHQKLIFEIFPEAVVRFNRVYVTPFEPCEYWHKNNILNIVVEKANKKKNKDTHSLK